MKTLNPTVIVIFGATGDLSHRKLIPALYNLFLEQSLPEQISILGIGHRNITPEAFRNDLREAVNRFSRRGRVAEEKWQTFATKIKYLSMDFTQGEVFPRLVKEVQEQTKSWKDVTTIYYLATAPSFIGGIVQNLGKVELLKDVERNRVVIEKPFGRDLKSAVELNQSLTKYLQESQIFRIDHFLGKQTVQNIVAFRFGNSMFEPVWNRNYIDHVQITVAEQLGVEHRGNYYETAGALRDMMENHLFQLLGIVAMEPPTSCEQDEVRNKKVDVLRALRPIPKDQVDQFAVRGQYGAGKIEDKAVPGYRQEDDIAPESMIETYAAMKLFIDNWRWQGVPFYLRTGKRLKQSLAEISIQFRDVPHRALPIKDGSGWTANQIIIRIQPEEEVVLRLQAKIPGAGFEFKPVDMRFNYREAFSVQSPEAYETLLLDVMEGDAISFVREDLEEKAWEIVDPVLQAWAAQKPREFPNYAAGSWGPVEADALIARDGGRKWLLHD